MQAMLFAVWWILLIYYFKVTVAFFDPISLGIGGVGLGLGVYNFEYLKEQTYCRLQECCNERSIPGNISTLENLLETTLFGQHIVEQHLIPALRAHFSPVSRSRKALVISFHGTPGTGKNFVAAHIASALYSKGIKSKYVYKYMGRADFPFDSELVKYKFRINDEIRNAIEICPRSLFIFDEVDKMPTGLFESISSFLDYHPSTSKLDFSQAVFIFLSNTAGPEISQRLGQLLQAGTLREETKLSDFKQILERTAYNEDGGFKKTSLIETHVIDHYLPFLPLEKKHIYKCLEKEFLHWNATPEKEKIENIIKDGVMYDRTFGLFAISGCKTLDKKVAVKVMST